MCEDKCPGCGKKLLGVGSDTEYKGKKYCYPCFLDAVNGPGSGAKFIEACKESRMKASEPVWYREGDSGHSVECRYSKRIDCCRNTSNNVEICYCCPIYEAYVKYKYPLQR
jgi:hypothetical protein